MQATNHDKSTTPDVCAGEKDKKKLKETCEGRISFQKFEMVSDAGPILDELKYSENYEVTNIVENLKET
jgi:hypothetical protein